MPAIGDSDHRRAPFMVRDVELAVAAPDDEHRHRRARVTLEVLNPTL